MKKKLKRLEAIKVILSSREVNSQGELLDLLRAEGFKLTQATLSRDMKQLKVAKASNTKGDYVYILPNDVKYRRQLHVDPTDSSAVLNGVISLTFSNNIAVIHTRPGYASSIAYDLDQHIGDVIVGTVAGDDTILIVLAEDISRTIAKKYIANIVPNIL